LAGHDLLKVRAQLRIVKYSIAKFHNYWKSLSRVCWRESRRNSVFRSRWARSIRMIKAKEIEDLDRDNAALDWIATSRFSKILSTLSKRQIGFRAQDERKKLPPAEP
jgi:hypothetical protein